MSVIDALAQKDIDRQFMYCWNRAEEWVRWPSAALEPLVPFAFVARPAIGAAALGSLLVANVAWNAFACERFVNLPAAATASRLAQLKWMTVPGCAAFLWATGSTKAAVGAALTPAICYFLGHLVAKRPVAAVHERMMNVLGHQIWSAAQAAEAIPAPKPIARAHRAG